jgi:hypothetical protein
MSIFPLLDDAAGWVWLAGANLCVTDSRQNDLGARGVRC